VPTYEVEGFTPPAPVVRAVVRGPTGVAHADIPLLIDTGADVSAVPRAVAEGVAADVRTADVELQLYDGTVTRGDVANLAVEFLRFRFQGKFVVADAPHGIVGRNILNLLVTTLDGPAAAWSVA
jgi:predicted aspartyl protease